MAKIEQRRDYSSSPDVGAKVDLDSLPLVKAAIDAGRVRRGDIERVVTLMAPEMLDEMAAAARSFQAARGLDGVRIFAADADAVAADLAEREQIAREYGLDLEDVPTAFATADPDRDLAERQQIARDYNLDLEDVA